MLMLIVSWWFIVLIVNILFYDLIQEAKYSTERSWLGITLAITNITLTILLFRLRGI
ncbi:MAG: hypothetical protein ACI4T3_01650 [Lactobacillus sp.]